jgi:hypothetical protein
MINRRIDVTPLNIWPEEPDDPDSYLPEWKKKELEELKKRARPKIVEDLRNERISNPAKWLKYVNELKKKRGEV